MESRHRLIHLMRQYSFAKKRVVLASGRESDFFIDCKQTVLSAEGHALVGEVMLEMLETHFPCDAIAAVELGGCPLASAVSLTSFMKGRPLPAIYVRNKNAKDGKQRLLEGDRVVRPGLKVVVLEDVITGGSSVLKAIGILRDAGADVVGVLALVDREEGGRDAIRSSAPFLAVASRKDFFPD
jgi:orotate phosphoribosyltransferase